MERAVHKLGVGPGPGDEATAGREQPVEATVGGTEREQDDSLNADLRH
jgi:hypothetical protein